MRGALPAAPSPLIGRDADVAAACDALLEGRARLLTLTGPPGVGKTRLALAVADGLSERFEHGGFFVDLAPLRDPRLVAATTTRALGVWRGGRGTSRATLQGFLRDRELLLVLDNFEHVLDAAPALAELLTSCPRLVLLVTSRAALRLRWERELPVAPLRLPTFHGRTTIQELLGNPAVTLFVERARAVRPELELSDQTTRDVAAICVRLDGLPLAIELAAARVKLLPPRAMLEWLQGTADRPAGAGRAPPLHLLTGGAQDLPSRQRTLRDAIDWSHRLLTTEEQALFRRLAVFVGGCTIDAAEAVTGLRTQDSGLRDCPGSVLSPQSSVLDLLASLIDKSLLRQEEAMDGEPRLRMLETIHEYARERLVASGELAALREHHAAFYVGLAERADPELLGPGQLRWLTRLEAEHANLAAVLAWARTVTGADSPGTTAVELAPDFGARSANRAAVGLRMSAALHWFWWLGGHVSEGRRWLNEMLRLHGTVGEEDEARARALYAAGGLAMVQGDYAEAEALLRQSAEIYDRLGDPVGFGRSLAYLGLVAWFQGDRDAAQALYDQSMPLLRESGDNWGLAFVGSQIASAARQRGDLKTAVTLIEEHVALARSTGDRYLLGSALSKWGNLAFLEQHDFARATELFSEALSLFRELRDGWWTARCLEFLGLVACERGEYDRAALLLGAAGARLEEIGARLIPGEQAKRGHAVATARAALGESTFAADWAEGRSMQVDRAIDYALAGSKSGPPRTATTAESATVDRGPDPLTRRERQTAALIARGLTNRQIADELVITRGAAANYVQRVLEKLGFHSRAQVAAWAVEHGFGPTSPD